MDPTRSFTPPEYFEEYRLVRPLGKGAMGQVYLAHDTLLDRPVAIKFIAAVEPGEAARQQFFTEARAIARLSHVNVVAVYRVGEIARRPYLVSELVRGESLDKVAKPLPGPRALRIATGLARGLAAAHRRGVLHRDIKPANAMLTEEGEVKLLDFGLAKLLDGPVAPVRVAAAGLDATLPGRDGPVRRTDEQADRQDRPPGGNWPVRRTDDPAGRMHDRPSGGNGPVRRADDPAGRTHDRPPGQGPPPPPTGAPSMHIGVLPLPTGATVTGTPAGGDLVGSPLYMAPEIWRGEEPTQQADIYSLGTLLYELCSGKAPHADATLAELPWLAQEVDARPLKDGAPDLDPELCAIVDRCLCRDPRARFASGDDLREALEQLGDSATGQGSASAVSLRRGGVPEGPPYPGLQSFDAQHRGLFFGRDGEVRAIVDRLRSDALVLVAGDSGAGKSSLCRAGVLEALSDEAQGEGRTLCRVLVSPGKRPLQALLSALYPLLPSGPPLPGPPPGESAIMLRLSDDPAFLAHGLRRRFRPVPAAGTNERLVVFIDQMEELLTVSLPEEAAACGEVLAALCECGSGVRVLGTVRSDFLTRLTALPGIGKEVGRSLHLVSPLSGDELRAVIVEPARRKGYRFETPALVEALVATAVAGQTSGLPLLQFALQQLWQARDEARRMIPAAALQAMGGVEGALARHADEVLLHLLPAQREAARRLLGKLVTAEGTRRRRPEMELCGPAGKNPDAHAALQILVRGRLLQVRAGEGGESEYELAHEALLTGWGTLRGWLARDAELRVLRQRLERAVAEWERLGRAPELLWREILLQESRGLDPDDLAQRELTFLALSQREARRERVLRFGLMLGVPLVLLLSFLGLRLQGHRQLSREVDGHLREARAQLGLARDEAGRFVSARATALALFDERHLEQGQGEAAWQVALGQAARARRDYAGAAHEVEAVLVLDAGRKDARDLLGDVLYEWALHEEREMNPQARDEILQRLSLYDDGGARQRRWREPARLFIDTKPPGAQVMLERVVESEERRRVTVAAGELPSGGEAEVQPGSYVLLLSAPGRATVRYPVLLSRGERLRPRVELPPAGSLPEGFVYVPEGRFLFGSAAEGIRRTFFNTAPLHEVHTGAYLIARDETRFLDWIAYLRALPAGERARRLPRSTNGLQSAVQLIDRGEGSFELELRPNARTYTARSGEPIRYGKRDRRAVQDWLRFPVTGISFEDAAEYASWLDRTGRVRGARLCTEYEWERAARGADDRPFPQGTTSSRTTRTWTRLMGRSPSGSGRTRSGRIRPPAAPSGWTTCSGTSGSGPGRACRTSRRWPGAAATIMANRLVPA